jgi:hypothetical protein
MRKYFLPLSALILALTSCELLPDNPDEYLFKSDNGFKYKYSDFELYDSSTHILYFKTNHPEFRTEKTSGFSILANGDEIYKGIFYPPYSSTLPYGAFIGSFLSIYEDYSFQIGFLKIDNQPEDLRNDPRIISAMEQHNLLHSGLSMLMNSVETGGTQLTFRFTVTNEDLTDLLILDPDKMGFNLFHYFTNGLIINNASHETVFINGIESEKPSPWNSWKTEWLSELKSGESKQFTISYIMASPLSPGKYDALFEFPGLSYQVSREQLYQGNSRIWRGELPGKKEIIIDN